MKERKYVAIDLKSFYASVECVERGLDPLSTNLVVADSSRTEKTICLAVSPSLKSFGISGRARLFEVNQRVEEVNKQRRAQLRDGKFTGSSSSYPELMLNPSLRLDFIIAPPRMAHYIAYSNKIYDIYLHYISPDDIHVYSIDEVFIDVTGYLNTYGLSAHELAARLVREVYKQTGITATVGIGTNMYLAKIAMDIVAKHIPAGDDGARIAELDEMSYRRQLWAHEPITDFWRVGRGYAKRLEQVGLKTMGDIARCSVGKKSDFHNEALLYKLFGINAELLIDHAWGWEPCRISDIKAYKPSSNSLSSGQVLHCPYDSKRARLIVMEMTDLLVLDLVEKELVTDQLTITIGYDIDNLLDSSIMGQYDGEIVTDRYGRKIPKHSHGTAALKSFTSSSKIILEAAAKLYDKIINPNLLVRRINVCASRVVTRERAEKYVQQSPVQLDLFTDYAAAEEQAERERSELELENKMQRAVLDIKKRFGKNAILKGMNLKEGATARDRNNQIGGHKA